MGKRKASYQKLKRNKISTAQIKRHVKLREILVEQNAGSSTCGTLQEIEESCTFIDPEEYNRIQSHELTIEKVESPKTTISGNRIVDLNYILDWALPLQTRHNQRCTSGRLMLEKEESRGLGLARKLIFRCDQCDRRIVKFTEDCDKKSSINVGAVWGTLASGSTYSQLTDICASMDIPPMTYEHFKKIETELAETWKDTSVEDIELAGKEEYEAVVRKNKIDPDGIPFTTVYCDGGWSKRSYGHSYNASAGLAVIIGKETKKVLFLGVRNKYCLICTRAANKQAQPKQHICFKNWASSSSAMDADIITEGVNRSVSMHGLRYKRFIADGDSSVFAKIREKVSYGRYVEKVECTNHVIKNYGKALYKLKKDTKIPIAGRKLLTQNKIIELEKDLQKSISSNIDRNVEKLKTDLEKNIVNVFGNDETTLKNSGIYTHIRYALDLVIKKSHRLVHNETNNYSEMFMALVAKFNAGKRLNLTSRGGFHNRAYLSALQYNLSHSWQLKPYNSFMERPVGKNLQTRIMRKEKHIRRTKKQYKRPTNKKEINLDYGPSAMQPDLNAEEMASEKERILKRLQLSESQIIEVERSTVGQFGNPKYEAERCDRLTASYFGNVIKRRLKTTSKTLVKSILFSTRGENLGPAIDYGRRNEKVAIELLQNVINQRVEPAGLFVDNEYGFLGASPDGLVGLDALVEVKCLYKVALSGLSLDEAVVQKKAVCLHFVDGQRKLKQNHNYFYQIQGQLNISKKSFCYFVVYKGDPQDFHIEIIKRDENLWQTVMLPKLKTFYLEEILPTIISKNIT